jgi:trehalose 6-phosphate phosphatase
MARSLFTPGAWARLRALLRSDARVLVAFDLDGTLAPLAARPELTRVPRRTLRLLERAARARAVRVAVVSARPVSVLRTLLPIRRVLRIGQYGLEGPFAPPAPRLRALRAACARIARALRATVAGTPGAWIERKGLTVAVHFRAVAPGRLGPLRRLVARVAPAARRAGFHPVGGSRVIDFVPAGFDKGAALRGLVAAAAPRAVLYFGDSAGDEPAFCALGHGDFAVRVGRGPTRARYRVPDPRGVTRVLHAVIRLRAG